MSTTSSAKKAAILARVSTKEQAEEGYSLPAQARLLEEHGERQDIRVARKFEIPESARGATERRLFREMLEYVREKRIPIILVEKVDRLTRNFRDAVLINDWLEEDEAHQVHFVKQNLVLHKNSKSHEKFQWDIHVALARQYSNNLSEEVQKGAEQKLREGWLPAPPKLGYKTVGEKGKRIHVPDEPAASHVRRTFELYATGQYSTKKLAKVMYAEGFRTHSGKQVVKSDIHRMLSDPFYMGTIRWKGALYPGKHEPLVSRQLFEAVQVYLHRYGGPKYRKHNALFKGMIRCAECGGTVTWEIQKSHWYGHCNHYRGCTQRKFVRQEKVEEQIVSYFDNFAGLSPRLVEWIKKALKESHEDKIREHTAAVDDLKRQDLQVQQRMDRLYDEHLDEKIPKEFFERKLAQYTREKDAIRDALRRHDSADASYFELGSAILDLALNARKIYQEQASVEEKRQLLSLVFSNLTLDGEKVLAVPQKPFAVIAERSKNKDWLPGQDSNLRPAH